MHKTQSLLYPLAEGISDVQDARESLQAIVRLLPKDFPRQIVHFKLFMQVLETFVERKLDEKI